ncbi:hypothetical protein FQR65_LT20068 [Abscondita terminalis]|nr:hypothetical protein FQR65_LT20068 [Abscondita terminalis]
MAARWNEKFEIEVPKSKNHRHEIHGCISSNEPPQKSNPQNRNVSPITKQRNEAQRKYADDSPPFRTVKDNGIGFLPYKKIFDIFRIPGLAKEEPASDSHQQGVNRSTKAEMPEIAKASWPKPMGLYFFTGSPAVGKENCQKAAAENSYACNSGTCGKNPLYN